jgi:hypothetical protein
MDRLCQHWVAVLLYGDCFYVYWLEYLKVRSLKSSKRLRGAALKRGKSLKNLEKVTHICSACKSRFFHYVFSSSRSHSAVFENTILKSTKIT